VLEKDVIENQAGLIKISRDNFNAANVPDIGHQYWGYFISMI
jgi:hypothetical protein